MPELTRADVEAALKQVIDPYLEQDLISAKAIKQITIDAGRVAVDVVVGYPGQGSKAAMITKIKDAVSAATGAKDIAVAVSWKIEAHSVQKGLKPLPAIKNIIAVASGKGGVGKSTVAVNLALALSIDGANVGVLDADIYGPSQPRMLGVKRKPESKDGRSIEPVEAHGLQSMSIGFLIDEETPMVWRGPMVTQALEQLLKETNWRDLDYLVIDLPPGTGDTQQIGRAS